MRISIHLLVDQKRFIILAAIILALALFVIFGLVPMSYAQNELTIPSLKKNLIVGTKEAPPFSMKDKDKRWTGISIDLWRQIANELNLTYKFVELDQYHLLKGLTDGTIDAVVAELTITPERLSSFDFTYPFYTTGLAIAVPFKEKSALASMIRQVFSFTVLKILLITISALLIVGFAVWFFERKRNPEHFGGNTLQGIGAGFWFSAVTMATVGYGDKHPKTVGGRIVSLIWMFTAVILVSLFTATITSILTVKQLETSVRGIDDLKSDVVGTMRYTTSETFLRNNFVAFNTYKSVDAGLEALTSGEVKAFVFDAPELRYRIKQRFQGKLEILPQTYSQENYGIALVNNSPLLKSINRVLLQKIRDQEWQGILFHYMGR